jgi:hypothetical protein
VLGRHQRCRGLIETNLRFGLEPEWRGVLVVVLQCKLYSAPCAGRGGGQEEGCAAREHSKAHQCRALSFFEIGAFLKARHCNDVLPMRGFNALQREMSAMTLEVDVSHAAQAPQAAPVC